MALTNEELQQILSGLSPEEQKALFEKLNHFQMTKKDIDISPIISYMALLRMVNVKCIQ